LKPAGLRPSPGQPRRLSPHDVELFFFDLDPERFQELQILVVDFKFRVRGKGCNERRFVGRLFSLLAHSDGSFEDQKNIVAAFFDAGDDFGDLLGIRERFVDGFAKFLISSFSR